MTYRDDLAALRARHDALQLEVTDRGRDLATTRALIDDHERRARLPILDNIQVAAPCTADWGQMTGSEQVRSCGSCSKRVYNLSELTRDEAEALIIEHEGKLCVRYFRRADGTILLKDCTVGVKRRRRRRIVAGAAALLASSGVAAKTLAPRTDTQHEPAREVSVMLGRMQVTPPAPPAPPVAQPQAANLDQLIMGEMQQTVSIDRLNQLKRERDQKQAHVHPYKHSK